ncbi:MAG: alpha/beta hydrolase [bacterium]|nr:alpha/beta hydrolase [bacterium]
MKNGFWFATVLCLLTTLPPVAPRAAPLDVVGTWQGSLTVQGFSLRIVFRITMGPDGGLRCLLDSPDQGATDIPTSGVTFENGALRIDVEAVAGFYLGTANDDVSEFTGEWTQGGQARPLVLRRSEKPIDYSRPQDPRDPLPYNVEDVTFPNEEAGITLAGTLTTPATGRPSPCVLLISGSGPQDRDEAIAGHRPFFVLSDHLTRQGIAVLRVDDRGIGESTGNFGEATTEDFASDAAAGIRYLESRLEIRPRKIGLLGHSEGGLAAAMVAAQTGGIAFVVLVAAPGVVGDELLTMQARALSEAEGLPEALVRRNLAVQAAIFEALKKSDSSTREERVRTVIRESLEDLEPSEQQQLGNADAYVEAQVQMLTSEWFLFFLNYDPALALRNVSCPVLALNGELDLQVPPAENLGAIAAALKEGGNTEVTIQELSGLNHLLQTARSGAPSEYSTIPETISPVVMNIISEWILLVAK